MPKQIMGVAADAAWEATKENPHAILSLISEGLWRARKNPWLYVPVTASTVLIVYGAYREIVQINQVQVTRRPIVATGILAKNS